MKRKATVDESALVFDARRKALGRLMQAAEIQELTQDLGEVRERDELPGGFLEVGISVCGRDVIVNHPIDARCVATGVGHLLFTPAQARSFAHSLISKADEIEDCKPDLGK